MKCCKFSSGKKIHITPASVPIGEWLTYCGLRAGNNEDIFDLADLDYVSPETICKSCLRAMKQGAT